MKLVINKHNDNFYGHIEKWEKGSRIRTLGNKFFFIYDGTEIIERTFDFIIELKDNEKFLYNWKEETLETLKDKPVNKYSGYREYFIQD